jgi:hypothetical protein
VVGGDDEDVFGPQGAKQLRYPVVEAAEVFGHALGIAPVAVLGVEVHEVGEDETALDVVERIQNGVHLGVVVGWGGEVIGDALAVEDVPDLADRHHRETRVFYEVHVGLFWRAYAVVVAVLVLAFVGARLAVVGPGDDALDEYPALAYEHLVGLLAAFV